MSKPGTERFSGRRFLAHGICLLVAVLLCSGCVQIQVPDPTVRYVAFGDSTTPSPDADPAGTYPQILRTRLCETTSTGKPARWSQASTPVACQVGEEVFAHEGRGGETTSEGLIRLEALLADGLYPEAEVLLYWEGGNDVNEFIQEHDRFVLLSPDDPDYPFVDELTRRLDETQANIESAIVIARQAGLEVYVATYYSMRESISLCDALPLDILFPPQALVANAYVSRLNSRIRAAAARKGAILVDVAAEDETIRAPASRFTGNASLLVGSGNYVDCNHLSAQGNQIVADVFFNAILASTGPGAPGLDE